jgi:hypothetical protein
MPALSEIGPDGLRGITVAPGVAAKFAITPGVAGSCLVVMRAAAQGRTANVTVMLGGETHSETAGNRAAVIRIGPFKHASNQVSVSVGTPGAPESLFISEIRLVPGRA